MTIELKNRIAAVVFAGTLAASGAWATVPQVLAAEAADAPAAEAVEAADDVAAVNAELVAAIATDPAGTHVVIDTYGNEVEIPNTVTSIVAPFPAATQCVLGLGGADLLSGCYILSSDMNDIMFGSYRDTTTMIKPSEINVEVVMNCNPDFAVVASEGQKEIVAETGAPVLLYSGSDFDTMKASVTMLAQAIGTQEALDKAVAYGDFYDRLTQMVGEMTADVTDEERPRVFVCTEDDGISSHGAGSMVSDWVALSGGVSICDVLDVEGGEVTLTAEQILDADPDIIICTTVAGRDAILGNPAFENVKAVADGKVYLNPLGGSVWFKAHFEAPLELTWAPTVIQPELTAELDTRAWVDEFYQTMYGYELSDADFDVIMNPPVGSR